MTQSNLRFFKDEKNMRYCCSCTAPTIDIVVSRHSMSFMRRPEVLDCVCQVQDLLIIDESSFSPTT